MGVCVCVRLCVCVCVCVRVHCYGFRFLKTQTHTHTRTHSHRLVVFWFHFTVIVLVRDCQSAHTPLAWWRPWLIPFPPPGTNYWKVLWGVDNTCLMKVNKNDVLGSHNERHMRSKCNVLFLCFRCGFLIHHFCSLSSNRCCPLPKVLSNSWPQRGGTG